MNDIFLPGMLKFVELFSIIFKIDPDTIEDTFTISPVIEM